MTSAQNDKLQIEMSSHDSDMESPPGLFVMFSDCDPGLCLASWCCEPCLLAKILVKIRKRVCCFTTYKQIACFLISIYLIDEIASLLLQVLSEPLANSNLGEWYVVPIIYLILICVPCGLMIVLCWVKCTTYEQVVDSRAEPIGECSACCATVFCFPCALYQQTLLLNDKNERNFSDEALALCRTPDVTTELQRV